MPAHRPTRPASRSQLSTGTLVGELDPNVVSRHLSELGDALGRSDAVATPMRARLTVSLKVGANAINHGLGRKAVGCTVTPTAADATWAWAMTSADTRTVTITCVGVAQPNAFVEVF